MHEKGMYNSPQMIYIANIPPLLPVSAALQLRHVPTLPALPVLLLLKLLPALPRLWSQAWWQHSPSTADELF